MENKALTNFLPRIIFDVYIVSFIKHATSENLINLKNIPVRNVKVMYFYYNFMHFLFYIYGERDQASE
jgi:hypothetical protein